MCAWLIFLTPALKESSSGLRTRSAGSGSATIKNRTSLFYRKYHVHVFLNWTEKGFWNTHHNKKKSFLRIELYSAMYVWLPVCKRINKVLWLHCLAVCAETKNSNFLAISLIDNPPITTYHCHSEIFLRTINDWNHLDDSIVRADTVSQWDSIFTQLSPGCFNAERPWNVFISFCTFCYFRAYL